MNDVLYMMHAYTDADVARLRRHAHTLYTYCMHSEKATGIKYEEKCFAKKKKYEKYIFDHLAPQLHLSKNYSFSMKKKSFVKYLRIILVLMISPLLFLSSIAHTLVAIDPV